jgi:ubiquinone/menaquinone biosynthesis C-methylase UbiE
VTDALVARRLARQRDQAAELERRVIELLGPIAADARALDVGCGTGALASALAAHVGEVVGIDGAPSSIEAARGSAPANCAFEVGDATALRFAGDDFTVSGCLRVLHHVSRPDLVVSELARVTHGGGTILVVDQLGSVEPSVAAATHAFERARDRSHERLLTDAEIRMLFELSNLVVRQVEITTEARELEGYLDLVGLEGEKRDYVRSLAPGPEYDVELGWYVAERRP